MDLLESILRTANAEHFTERFKEQGIETVTLSLLTDEDLRLLGIEEENIRQDILKRIANLHIPKEKKNNLVIDEDYVLTVLHCINQQILLHYASLSYAITKTDIVLCDVKLSPATQCLISSVENLQVKAKQFKELVCPEQKKSNRRYYLIAAVPVCLFVMLTFVKLKILSKE